MNSSITKFDALLKELVAKSSKGNTLFFSSAG
jgi:hypothetical protein